ncbi:MAG: cytidylate kinase-like family protein [Bacteroidales bacterium]|nr:MAG: cytidylate kinase-like family protein [Bacteroidales bacterium]
MAKVDLVQYLVNRHKECHSPCPEPGPIVTISREMGCSGTQVVQMLVNELNYRFEFKGGEPWRWIGKEEIQNAAAHALSLPPDEISYVMEAKKKTMMDDILHSFSSKYYKSDRIIRKTVKDVIRSIACNGRVVILGRGGVAITRDIPRSLHINLEAPLEWRTLRISERMHIEDIKEAENFVLSIDKQREEFRNYFGGKNTDYTRFDITFNSMTLTIREIVDVIIKAMEVRKFIY